MKKFAILGTSNALVKYGYGSILKEIFKDKCDIYSIGDCSSLAGIWSLLSNDISGKYEFVLLDFNINETDFIWKNCYSLEYMIANHVFIINNLLKNNSKPIYCIFPYLKYDLEYSYSYIITGISEIYNIPILNLESKFLWIQKNKLSHDDRHPRLFYQKYVANEIIKYLSINYNPKIYEDISLQYFLYPMENIGLQKKHFGSSLIHYDCYKLIPQRKIDIPDNLYLNGITYWMTNNTPYLNYKNSYLNIIKNLSKKGKGYYTVRSIGYHFANGLKGGQISCTNHINNSYYELTGSEAINNSQHEELYIAGLILSNISAFKFGRDFYHKYYKIFSRHKYNLINTSFKFSAEEQKKFLKSLKTYFDDAENIFNEILQLRPDLSTLLFYDDKRIIRLFLWALLFGSNEIEILKNKKSIIKNALLRLIPYEILSSNQKLSAYLTNIIKQF